MLEFSIIVAVDEKLGIGKNGGLAWSLSGDMKHFKQITTSITDPAGKNAVIMGENTWYSLPEKFRPLPGRMNIIVSYQDQSAFPDDVFAAPGIDAALKLIESSSSGKSMEKAFIIGGASVYEQAIKMKECSSLYITHILSDFECDVFFPSFEEHFEQVSKSEIQKEKGLEYYFTKYKRQGQGSGAKGQAAWFV